MATLQRQNSALSSNPFLVHDRERKARGGLSDGTADRALRWAAKAKAHKKVFRERQAANENASEQRLGMGASGLRATGGGSALKGSVNKVMRANRGIRGDTRSGHVPPRALPPPRPPPLPLQPPPYAPLHPAPKAPPRPRPRGLTHPRDAATTRNLSHDGQV